MAAGKVVTSINDITDDVVLAAGDNVTIDQLGRTLSISATGAGGADEDWVIDGSDMHAGVSGNVGIGTSSPAADLHVGSAATPSYESTATISTARSPSTAR